MKTSLLIKSLLVAFSVAGISAQATTQNSSEYRAYNTPVNYNFTAISFGQESIDEIDTDTTLIKAGGSGMLSEVWLYEIYYTGSLVDETDLSGLENTLSFGISHRFPFPLNDKLDLVLGAGVAYAWYDLEYISSSNKDNDYGLLFSSSIRYGFTEKLEGSVGLSSTRLFDDTATIISGEISYYPTDNFGFGLSLSETSANVDSSAISAHIKLNFN